MRTINFRGKDIFTDKWVYGDLLRLGDAYAITTSRKKEELTVHIFSGRAEFRTEEIAVVYPDTVGQFTGLYDADGVEIYEGDILQELPREEYAKVTGIAIEELDDLPLYEGRKVAVSYDAPSFSLVSFGDYDYGYRFLNRPELFRVVGNIHDK